MKKLMYLLILQFIMMLTLQGCGQASESKETTEMTGSQEEIFGSLDPEWRDNSLDPYCATAHPVALVATKDKDGVLGGTPMSVLGQGGAAFFTKHLYEENPSKCWDEVVYVTRNGEVHSVKIAEGTKRQAWGLGSMEGDDGYIAFFTDASETGCSLVELDLDMKETRRISLSFLSKEHHEFPFSMMKDEDGAYHLIVQNFDTLEWYYYICSSEGELVRRIPLEIGEEAFLFPLGDGRVAYYENGENKMIQPPYTEDIKPVKLELPEGRSVKWDEGGRMLVANRQGVFLKSSSGDEEKLCTWFDHGINIGQIEGLRKTQNQGINVLYADQDGHHLVHMEPVKEKTEITEISFAVTSFNKTKYQEAVMFFNRQYPSIRISLKEYRYGDERLMSELISGNGPVIFDTSLMDFEGLVKYWEPIEKVLAGMEIEDELIPNVMDLGRIDGKQYGIAPTFYLKTVITADQNCHDWTYDGFLKRIEKDDSLKAAFNSPVGDDGFVFVTKLLMHGMEDSFFWDAEKSDVSFDSDESRKALRMGKHYQGKNGGFEQLMDGTMLCVMTEITSPQQIAFIRVLMGEKANYVGYPTKDGACHFLASDSILTVRQSASDEEKKAAHLFLKTILSSEVQTSLSCKGFAMSVKKDVLDAQIDEINTGNDVSAEPFPQITLREEDIDCQRDGEMLYELIRNAKPEGKIPRGIVTILTEELDPYFSEGADEETVIRNLTERVKLYLTE